jgi:hypothetical protein
MEVWTKSCKTSTSNIFYTLGNAFSFGFSYPFQIAIASYGDIVYYIIVCVNATSIWIVRSSGQPEVCLQCQSRRVRSILIREPGTSPEQT